MKKSMYIKSIKALDKVQKEKIKKRLSSARNKTEEWDAIKQEYSLEGTWSYVKQILVDEKLLSPDAEPLSCTSPSEYKEFMEEQALLSPEEKDKQLSSLSHCPLPTKGTYTDVKGFLGKAQTDRQTLLSLANQVARETQKSCLPVIYSHGFAMTWPQLRTLMEASGFVLEERKEAECDPDGTLHQRTISYFSDHEPEFSGISDDSDTCLEVRLDYKKQTNNRISFGIGDDIKDMLDDTIKEVFRSIPYTTARESKVKEAIVRLGISELKKRRAEGTLRFRYEMTRTVHDEVVG